MRGRRRKVYFVKMFSAAAAKEAELQGASSVLRGNSAVEAGYRARRDNFVKKLSPRLTFDKVIYFLK